MTDANTDLLASMAEALGDLREQLVFVGGCATSLLITDTAASPVRATADVDAIVAITSLPDYQHLGSTLSARGFNQSLAEGDPPYRWGIGGMKLDVMPIDESVLGFSNRWYGSALRTATAVQLPNGLRIHLVTPACFIATKLEAFEDRGQGDWLGSHDLEDVLSVIDGRSEIVAEMAGAEPELRRFVAEVFARLLKNEDFLNALPGMVLDGSPATRGPILLDRLRSIVTAAEA